MERGRRYTRRKGKKKGGGWGGKILTSDKRIAFFGFAASTLLQHSIAMSETPAWSRIIQTVGCQKGTNATLNVWVWVRDGTGLYCL